ncbi:PAS domain-containing sensor histidine kinase [Natrinema marinum]|uniref:sensor histidine kinase n=1 Tax=Natrinema marinum TaxID=2961598 RepID=UPI0020C8BB9F|nr:PAS domain-containing sensor histidine kinase [Natrinema marinum]
MTDSDSFVTAGFDAMPAHVAILDESGTIVYTNESWDTFGDTQGLPETTGGVGSNYLDVCDASDDEEAPETARGIRAVAAGERDEFSLEYPCHTPERERWFMMRATPYEHDGGRFVLVMHVDITERHRLEQQNRDQAERMEGFAKLLSHDLRNPLAVALAQAEMLELDDDIDLDRTDGERSDLRSSLERMESIIEDALVLVSTDRVEKTEPLPLANAVDTAWAHVRTDAATVSVVDDIVIRADPTLVSHLFENLFRNAIEHAGEDSHIEIGALEGPAAADASGERTAEADSLERPVTDGSGDRGVADGFYIEDDGPGIPADEREQVFESGYSSDGGSGFGLAIVREVVDAHGWSIEATAGRDGGARFEIQGVSTLDA